jgi:drug/metabolite transporter (DMT)-like permease
VIAPEENRTRAALLAMFAVGLATAQDAIVKSVSGAYPAHETVILRCVSSIPILGAWLWWTAGFRSLITPYLRWLIIRGLILCSAYLAFVLSIAAMPIANAVAIYFTMPFIIAALAGPFLKEHVPHYRWLAIAAAFIGVIIMVRPGSESFEPAALLALYSALGYAIGQMMGRSLSQNVEPIVISNVQNVVYLGVGLALLLIIPFLGLHSGSHKSIAFLTRPFAWPTPWDTFLLCFMGALSTLGMVAFINAYKLAPSNFVAPFEYTAMIWAVLYGLIFFNDFPDIYTWTGIAIVVLAGLWMLWKDSHQKTG